MGHEVFAGNQDPVVEFGVATVGLVGDQGGQGLGVGALPAVRRRSMLWTMRWAETSRPRCSEAQMEADAKNAPGSPMSTHTTATTETIILTARARMAALL